MTLLLALCCAFLPVFAHAESRDFSYVKARSETLDFNVDEERSLAFISSRLSSADLSFSHPDELEDYYSYTYFDVLANSSSEDDRYTLMRLWIVYSGPNYQHFNRVSFRIPNGDGEVTYTFMLTDLDVTREMLSGGVYEEMVIRFGERGLPFLAELEKLAKEAGSFKAMEEKQIHMTLHGDEEVEVQLTGEFLMDFALVKDAFVQIGGLDDIGIVHETEMQTETTAF